ncbi:DctP family TRAP transporter solute-binding subunit [Azospirillum sp. RWY-5-1]|uniref:DctP family TRAP transporter solute-binding subunit n=1 Tax=Azospirillum oleiclasticum TaxID=2735135 RepID=A0ABX2TF61_9PROT|nr:DctP family TRAP transporter solute-binding subunit [Azospirillum oleiclasticum]NYZ16095.1 DctP family TRAP transporter solute-binding subunit [Azospirillum oleiclasticum]NYZ22976.1 DctP family TRAP transporter solute-binding subunit [Azospirillum oleiclasticum]
MRKLMTQGWSRRSMLALGAGATALAVVRPANAAVSLRMAVADPAGSSVGQAATRFAELVKEKTGGAVTIQIFPDGLLFGNDQNAAINQLGGGSLDGLILASSVYASFEPRMNAVSLPYMFSDYDQLTGYLEGAPGKTLLASLDRLRIEGLGLMIRTFRNTTTRNTAITTAEAFKGLKLRVPNNKLFVQLFQALGANPTPMAFAEVYTALQLGAIDGQENPVEVPMNNRFYEVQKHLNMTRHVADSYVLALSKTAWGRIPENQRDTVREAAAQTVRERNAKEIAQESAIVAQLKEKGMAVNEFQTGELEKVQKTATGLYPQFAELVGKEFLSQTMSFVGKS